MFRLPIAGCRVSKPKDLFFGATARGAGNLGHVKLAPQCLFSAQDY